MSDGVMEELDLLVGGVWRRAQGEVFSVENPSTGQKIAQVGAASDQDVDDAVHAARAAAPGWQAASTQQRRARVAALVEVFEQRADEIARLIELEQGSPAALARKLHVDVPIAATKAFLSAIDELDHVTELGNSTIVREPIGVVAAITPWNVPFHQAVIKVVPALAAGNTVVLKPSELTPLSAIALARAIEAAGFPPGVFNLVNGEGAATGDRLVTHPGVDHVSFTGSTDTGKRIAAAAAADLKGVTLELGGKSASVVLSSCSDELLVTAVKMTVADCYLNGGQTCTALSRLIVPADRLAEVEELAATAAAKHLPGTRLGPLISAAHQRKVLSYLEPEAIGSARVVFRGATEDLPEQGYFVPPVVVSSVDPGSVLAQEEIFGPVLAIIAAGSDEEALAIANDSPFGLTAAVWSDDPDAATAAASALRTGQVNINGGRFNVAAPFGGYKQSGLGRELGRHGLEDMLQTKAVQR